MTAINDPAKLYLPDPDYSEKSWFGVNYGWMAGGLFGLCTSIFSAVVLHKPYYAGTQKHILYMVGGGFIGKFLHERRNLYLQDRDAAYRHYIELHPEDFPIPERVLVKDLFKPWMPVR